ncbi:MAG TPA: diadenylate cyclase CdaA [Candidatus Sphingobacterium stercoripullorum]|uniref:Diadenylate cyclase n=1 Tax=Candidatus Sphingobacterium stercoripullorum TaxID=2838759 RepID=A0A9D1W9S8_9SPHI|nr:diadenylate cyclase CdaA [Candidatus Sphingobacterium stercoripullorum]HLR51207.1 diadenylate cyclase CdaA [Candidatus Sphingobacterium stercoripullorum]
MEATDFNLWNSFRLLDLLDVVLVAIILYYIYSLIKGTIAVNILTGVVLFYGIFLVVRQMEMHLLTEIFGGFISVGSIALIVVFQQEIRRFLLHIGRNISLRQKKLFWRFIGPEKKTATDNDEIVKAIVDACRSMSRSKTGALMVFSKYFEEEYYQTSGELIDAGISKRLLESIFFKNSPLHDGAVIIVDNRIMTASSVLPLSDREDLPPYFGLRHRAAIGVTEISEAVAVIVSEETGEMSFVKEGNINLNLSADELQSLLVEEL